MEKLFDKLILFLCCTIFLISHDLSLYTILPVIVVICLSSVTIYFDKTAFSILTYFFYVGLCLLSPNFICFLPVMSYDLVSEPYRYVIYLGIFAVAYALHSYPPLTILILLLLTVLSWLLKKRTLALTQAKQDYFTLRDEMMERAEQLRLQNRDLLDKQDYEVSNATLNERNRIAREIHDTVGHLLSSSILQIGALLAICRDEAMKESLVNIKNTLSTGMDSIRSSIHNIHEDSLDLQAQLNELTQNFSFCKTILSYHVNHDFTMKAKYSILFIVKEALSNIMKHSNATLVTITVSELPGLYQLIIHDNGSGGSPGSSSSDSSGMGIQSMSERINGLGGNFYTDTRDGFKIFVSLPKTETVTLSGHRSEQQPEEP